MVGVDGVCGALERTEGDEVSLSRQAARLGLESRDLLEGGGAIGDVLVTAWTDKISRGR